jgi:hypothetical protein
MDQFNVAGLMDQPVETLTQALVLRFKPLNLDVLPLYIVLMAVFPLALWLMLRWPDETMVASVKLYFLAPSLPVEPDVVSGRRLVFRSIRLAIPVHVGRMACLGRGKSTSGAGKLEACSDP